MARRKTATAAVSNTSEDEREPGEITLAELKREVAERRKAEKELRESERRFRDIAEFVPQVIFEMDADCMLTFVTGSLRHLRYTPHDVKGILADSSHPRSRGLTDPSGDCRGNIPNGSSSHLRMDGPPSPIAHARAF
jgi:PAS domain-containing protein